jgi:ABC-2 type transport system permease protein
MTRLVALTKKEFLLVFRDRNAILALFILPAVFILIMSLALRDTGGKEALLTYKFSGGNQAAGNRLAPFLTAGGQIRQALPDEAPQFVLALGKDGEKIAVTIDYRVEAQALALFRAQLTVALLRLKLAALTETLDSASGINTGADEELVSFTWNAARAARPSPTQQSVPSWIIFAMFFIVMPLSNVFVAERRQNTLARLCSMDIGFPLIMAGKILPYFVINQLQTFVMILTGVFITPLCGGEALRIAGSWPGLMLISAAVSCGAIGLALFLATVAQTAEQASTLGGIINVLFGAIGGLMAPKFLMPEFMQRLAVVSPMSWGLDGFLKIFVKGDGIYAVAGESAMLLLFGLSAMVMAAVMARKKG